MINAAFNVGAIAGSAKLLRESQREPIYIPHHTPMPESEIMGYISIESNPCMSVRPSMSVDSVEVRFRSVAEVNKLIGKLISLRDNMIEKTVTK